MKADPCTSGMQLQAPPRRGLIDASMLSQREEIPPSLVWTTPSTAIDGPLGVL